MTTVESTRRPLIISLRRRRNNQARTAWKLDKLDAELKKVLLRIEETESRIAKSNYRVIRTRLLKQRHIHKKCHGDVVASFTETANTATG